MADEMLDALKEIEELLRPKDRPDKKHEYDLEYPNQQQAYAAWQIAKNTVALATLRDNQLERAVVQMAYALAGGYTGPGSGPTAPKFWLDQMLGEGNYDPEIIERYKPEPARIEVHADCSICGQNYLLGVATEGHPVHGTPYGICPECDAKQPQWMTPRQKMYYGLKVITLADFVTCSSCWGTGDQVESDCNEVHRNVGGCTRCQGAGRLLSEDGEAKIQTWDQNQRGR